MYIEGLTKLGIAQNFCFKYIQALPKRTRSIFVQNIINDPSIQVLIGTGKMIILGRVLICSLNNDILGKQGNLPSISIQGLCTTLLMCFRDTDWPAT